MPHDCDICCVSCLTFANNTLNLDNFCKHNSYEWYVCDKGMIYYMPTN